MLDLSVYRKYADEGDAHFKSGLFTTIDFLGLSQSRFGGLVVDQRFARFLQVVIAEFRVQQKIIIGFLLECFDITSGSL